MKKLILIILFFISIVSYAQVSIASLPFVYTQNFGVVDKTTWTDNSTYSGWYADNIAGTLHQNITTAVPTNNGGFYTYECNGNNDEKIGSRASGGTGTINYGVRFANNTGSTINSITLSFDWFQLSVAGNENTVNTIQVGYRVAPSVTDLTTGSYLLATTFIAPKDTLSGCNSCMYRGLPCTVTGHKTICIDVSSPSLANGKEIMIKWVDVNDANNDHHTAIDNVSISFSTSSCAALPIELISFDCATAADNISLYWSTASETNNQEFQLWRSTDAVNFKKIATLSGAGTSSIVHTYVYVDYFPEYGSNYYKLVQQDYDGNKVTFEETPCSFVQYQYVTTIVYYDNLGQVVDINNVKPGFYVKEYLNNKHVKREMIYKK